MKLSKFLISIVSFVFLQIASTTMAADYTLRIHHFLPDDSLPHTSLVVPWAQKVEKESNGRIDVKIYPAMALGGKTQHLVDQAVDGTVDIVWTAAAYTPTRFPHAEVFTLPLVHNGNAAATNQALMSQIDGLLATDFKGLKPLLTHVQAGHSLHLPAKTVKGLEDMKGLKIRPAGRRVGLWVLDALGLKHYKKRHPKLSEALAQNKLDGAMMSFQLAETLESITAVKSHTMLAEDQYFGTSLYLFLMNLDSYNALPKDLQQVIDNNSGMELARETGLIWQHAEEEAIAAARKHGNTINILDEEQQARAEKLLLSIHHRWAADVAKHGVDGMALIEQARRLIAKYM